jgi:hypothetical protein
MLVAMGIRIIQQTITAGSNFDGLIPTTTPIHGHDIEKEYPTDVHGGLFEFDLTQPAVVYAIEIKFGGQSAWAIHKKDHNGDEFLLYSGTTEAFLATLAKDRTLITEGQKLLLRTTGASTKMIARVAVGSEQLMAP